MKTLLSIGVFVAVIFWSSGKVSSLKCWGLAGNNVRFVDEDGFETARYYDICMFNGTARDKKCNEIQCGDQEPCVRHSFVNKTTSTTETWFYCGATTSKCLQADSTEMTQTFCPCYTELCNDRECKAEKIDGNWICKMEPQNGPQNGADGTSYTHFIIAFIVGAIFLH